jgi:hypothetical protein
MCGSGPLIYFEYFILNIDGLIVQVAGNRRMPVRPGVSRQQEGGYFD